MDAQKKVQEIECDMKCKKDNSAGLSNMEALLKGMKINEIENETGTNKNFIQREPFIQNTALTYGDFQVQKEEDVVLKDLDCRKISTSEIIQEYLVAEKIVEN